ncbi:unnamed protein product [Lactuca saligna]|uniref:Uncharacterized protein n=1 Tax=Lactuca saligna TaxID=75948 RepID=A0AA36A4B4_LACSI|nr:unnamed protein product [Lactuca saligna]
MKNYPRRRFRRSTRPKERDGPMGVTSSSSDELRPSEVFDRRVRKEEAAMMRSSRSAASSVVGKGKRSRDKRGLSRSVFASWKHPLRWVLLSIITRKEEGRKKGDLLFFWFAGIPEMCSCVLDWMQNESKYGGVWVLIILSLCTLFELSGVLVEEV